MIIKIGDIVRPIDNEKPLTNWVGKVVRIHEHYGRMITVELINDDVFNKQYRDLKGIDITLPLMICCIDYSLVKVKPLIVGQKVYILSDGNRVCTGIINAIHDGLCDLINVVSYGDYAHIPHFTGIQNDVALCHIEAVL